MVDIHSVFSLPLHSDILCLPIRIVLIISMNEPMRHITITTSKEGAAADTTKAEAAAAPNRPFWGFYFP